MKFVAGLLVCCAIILTTSMALSEAATSISPPDTEPDKEIADKQDKPEPISSEPAPIVLPEFELDTPRKECECEED